MLLLEQIVEEIDNRVNTLRVEGTSSRFSQPSDHDYIVGKIESLMEIQNYIVAILKEDDDEYERNAN